MVERARRDAGAIGDAVRVLIADDEAPARARLRQMLAGEQDIEIAGEAESGAEAMRMALDLAPDVLLLDIQMPGSNGIEVAASLPKPRPRVIFCTAYEQHAVDAFELHAIDYLLKPISRARLHEALERVRALDGSQDKALDEAVRAQHVTRFLVRSASRYMVVPESRVLYFSSETGLTRLVADNAQYYMEPTLNDLERRLHPAHFFRVSRAAVVNLDAVTEVLPMPGGGGEVVLRNGARLEVSRRRLREMLAAIEGRRSA
jgi:two-component system, LytTR family, response regulator